MPSFFQMYFAGAISGYRFTGFSVVDWNVNKTDLKEAMVYKDLDPDKARAEIILLIEEMRIEVLRAADATIFIILTECVPALGHLRDVSEDLVYLARSRHRPRRGILRKREQ